MIKRSFLSISLVSAGNVFNACFGFLFLAAVAKNLPLGEFGKYAFLVSLLVTSSRLLDFGTNSVYVAKSIIQDEKHWVRILYSCKLVLFSISTPITLFLLYAFGLAKPTTAILMLIGLAAYGINYTLHALFQKQEKYFFLVALNTIPAIIKGAAAVLVFLGIFIPSYTSAFGVFSLSIAPSFLLYFYLSKELRPKLSSFSARDLFLVLKPSFPGGISQIVSEAWPTINNAIAKITQGFTEVGIFSLADKISNIYSLISFSIFTVLLPKNASRKHKRIAYDYMETFMLSVLILLSAVATAIVAKHFVSTFFGEKFAGSIVLLDILIFSSAASAIYKFLENYYFVESKTHALMFLSLLRLAVFLLAATALIGAFSLYGLAWANLLSSLAVLGLSVLFIIRDHRVNSGVNNI